MKTFEQLFTERCINVKAFALMNGIKPTSLYSILAGKTNPSKVGITLWLKIAHGLGMTGDELYTIIFGDADA